MSTLTTHSIQIPEKKKISERKGNLCTKPNSYSILVHTFQDSQLKPTKPRVTKETKYCTYPRRQKKRLWKKEKKHEINKWVTHTPGATYSCCMRQYNCTAHDLRNKTSRARCTTHNDDMPRYCSDPPPCTPGTAACWEYQYRGTA